MLLPLRRILPSKLVGMSNRLRLESEWLKLKIEIALKTKHLIMVFMDQLLISQMVSKPDYMCHKNSFVCPVLRKKQGAGDCRADIFTDDESGQLTSSNAHISAWDSAKTCT